MELNIGKTKLNLIKYSNFKKIIKIIIVIENIHLRGMNDYHQYLIDICCVKKIIFITISLTLIH
jgi:hypothetical protein